MKIDVYELPEDLKYQKDHYWVKMEGDIALVGTDDFQQQLAGEIVYVELPTEGDTIEQNEAIGSIESGKAVARIYAPLSGEIVEVNMALEDDPTLINTDPYNEGWIFKIKAKNTDELNNIISGADAITEWIKAEAKKHLGKDI